MGIFYESANLNNSNMMNEAIKHPDELMEAFIIDEVSFLPQDRIRLFCESGGVADQLIQEGKLRSKNTLVKMSKKDDLSRRIVMTCMQMAKDNNDPDWREVVKAQKKKNKHKSKIVKKYMSRATNVAKKTQNEFLHGGPKKTGVLPEKFRKFRGEDMASQED